MSAAIKQVTVLTGFLGAGKTTFLNDLLKKNENTRYAIIENEFGEQGIDGELVISPEETIVQLNNGCLCCTLNDNLYDILNTLFERRNEYDEIIIEATGVADPSALAEPFVSHPLIKKHFPLKGIICLVDVELIGKHLRETEEAKNQLTFSDVLLINKIDLVSPIRVQEVEQKLRQLNPLAKVVSGSKAAFPVIEFGEQQSPLEKIFLKAGETSFAHHEREFPVAKPHAHHHHQHTEEIVSHTFVFDQPFDHHKLNTQLYVYLQLHSADLYRMKGLVWFNDFENQVLVQSVGKRLDTEEKRLWKPNDERKSVLVFIGKNPNPARIKNLLQECLSPPLSKHATQSSPINP